MDKGAIILARRYAQAYLALFYDTLSSTSYRSFEKAAALFKATPRIGFLLDLGVITRDVKLREITALGHTCGLPDSAKKIIGLVVDHKRGSLLGEVFAQIADLYKHRARIDECHVSSSSSLTAEEKKKIEYSLEQQAGVSLSFDYTIDPTLIAGIRCQTTALLWEDSVDQKLRRLEQILKR